ncbi:MAG: ATP-binding cassette domain-containing protein [Calothrix sp. SM1_5_4]|nr:ATP-binding cassette domain-containing protein [Calothrix sp. SM1_5_4]
MDHGKSVLKNLCPEGDYVDFQGQFVHVRSYLDRFFFGGPKAEMPVAKLSGGEQARLRLAQLMLQPSRLLVLDEPTNDLDGETLEILEESLRDFGGAVILVTHDRYFMDAVSNQILAFPPPEFRERSLQKFSSYFQWEEWFAAAEQKSRAQSERNESKPHAPPQAPAGTRVKMSYKDKFELENIESTILKLEEDLVSLTEQSQTPSVMSDHKKLAEIHSAIASKQSEIDGKYQRWAELEALRAKSESST